MELVMSLLWQYETAPRNELLRRTLVPEPVKPTTTSQTYLGFRITRDQRRLALPPHGAP
jgi:hypothetical protein